MNNVIPKETIRDIAPPVDFFPYPLRMVIVAGVLLAGLLLLIVWAIVRWIKRRPSTVLPTPRAAALQRLEEARLKIDLLAPYAFSILVSDVLRHYVSAQFQVPATRQTSPEFLAGVADAPTFSDNEKSLLSEFLEASDLIKFAKAEAGRHESEVLLEQAIQFVKGEAHELVQ
jgi:hypothetical protein